MDYVHNNDPHNRVMRFLKQTDCLADKAMGWKSPLLAV